MQTLPEETVLKEIRISAKKLAKKYPVEARELWAAGWDGYLKAMELYDPNSSATLLTYTVYKIHGYMLDYIRDVLTPVRRNSRLQFNKYEKTKYKLEYKHKRHITEQEIVDELNIEYSFYLRHKQLNSRISLSTPLPDLNKQQILSDIIPAPKEYESPIDFHQIIKVLNKRERHIFIEYYINNKTLKQIAEELQMSESRISQLMSESRTLLKEFWKDVA